MKIRMILFLIACVVLGLIIAVLAYFAHQNGDDPANWINWSLVETSIVICHVIGEN